MRKRYEYMLILILLLAGTLSAADIYVSPEGADSNAGSKAAPLLSLQKAIEKAGNGGTVYIQAGTYQQGKGLNLYGTGAGTGSLRAYKINGIKLLGGWNTDYSAQTGYTELNAGIKANDKTTYHTLFLQNVSDFAVEKIKFTGNGYFMNNCLRLEDCTNGKVSDITVEKCAGNGINITKSANIEVSNVDISGCEGNAIYALSIKNVNFHRGVLKSNNKKEKSKVGAFYLEKAEKCTVDNLEVTKNEGANGGGIGLFYCTEVSVLQCKITKNKAGNGGGVYILAGSYNVVDCTITGNEASMKDRSGKGGGLTIANKGGKHTIAGEISGNTADIGGGISIDGSDENTITAHVADNTVTRLLDGQAGGIFVQGEANIIAGIVEGNIAFKGGGVYLNSHKNEITGIIRKNTAKGQNANQVALGGGVYIQGSENVINGQILDNKADDGAGVHINSANGGDGGNEVEAEIKGNVAAQSGGGVSIFLTYNNSVAGTITGNEAPVGSGVAINASNGWGKENTVDAADISGNSGGAENQVVIWKKNTSGKIENMNSGFQNNKIE